METPGDQCAVFVGVGQGEKDPDDVHLSGDRREEDPREKPDDDELGEEDPDISKGPDVPRPCREPLRPRRESQLASFCGLWRANSDFASESGSDVTEPTREMRPDVAESTREMRPAIGTSAAETTRATPGSTSAGTTGGQLSFIECACPQVSTAVVELYNTVRCIHSQLKHIDATVKTNNEVLYDISHLNTNLDSPPLSIVASIL